MPRIPNEVLQKARISFKETISNDKKCLDFMMALVIFLVTLIELVSFFFPDDSNPATFKSYGDKYLIFWYPLFVQLSLLLFSIFFVLKVYRYKACIYSKIISHLYFLICLINVLAIIFHIEIISYLSMIYVLVLNSIVVLTFLKLCRWFSKLQ